MAGTPARNCDHHVGELRQGGAGRLGDQNGGQAEPLRFAEHCGHFLVEAAVGENQQRVAASHVEQLVGKHGARRIESVAAPPAPAEQDRHIGGERRRRTNAENRNPLGRVERLHACRNLRRTCPRADDREAVEVSLHHAVERTPGSLLQLFEGPAHVVGGIGVAARERREWRV